MAASWRSVSGQKSTQLFFVRETGVLNLKNITLQDGYNSQYDGGAITNLGSLTIESSKFFNNSTIDTRSGGAIVSYGPLAILDSEFSANQACNGGAVYRAGGLQRQKSLAAGLLRTLQNAVSPEAEER